MKNFEYFLNILFFSHLTESINESHDTIVVDRDNKNFTATSGTTIYLSCGGRDEDTTDVTWYRNIRRLPFDVRHHVFANGTFRIRNLDKYNDTGEYSCTVDNNKRTFFILKPYYRIGYV